MMIEMKNRKTVGKLMPCLLVLLQSLLYGFGDPISKVAYDVMPVYTLLSVRYLIAFVCLALLGGKRAIDDLKNTPIRVWLPPCLCIACCYVLSNVALKLAAATSVAFLRSLSTVMTPLMAWVIFRKRYSRRHILIQLFVIVGLYLLCGHGGLSGFGPGEALALLSALLMAGALIFGQNAVGRIQPLTLTAVQAGSSAVVAAIGALLFDGGFDVSAATPTVWGIILYLALACTAAGYLLQNTALRSIPARTVALLQCTCPILTGVFSFFILHEHLTPAGIVGSGIILLCVAAEILVREAPAAGDMTQNDPTRLDDV